MAAPLRDIPHDTGFVEVADRCWVARFEFLDVNVGLVGGDRGLLVVDTHASEVEARRVVEQVRAPRRGRRGRGGQHPPALRPRFRQRHLPRGVRRGRGPLPVYAHDSVPDDLAHSGPLVQATARDDADRAPGRRHRGHPDRACPPTRSPPPGPSTSATGSSSWCTPAAATPRGDVVVRVGRRRRDVRRRPGRGVRGAQRGARASATTASRWSGRPPSTWSSSCSARARSSCRATGCPSTRTSCRSSAAPSAWWRRRSATSRAAGVPVADALDAAEWPYPKEQLGRAVERGYAHLPRSARSLPLL